MEQLEGAHFWPTTVKQWLFLIPGKLDSEDARTQMTATLAVHKHASTCSWFVAGMTSLKWQRGALKKKSFFKSGHLGGKCKI